MYGSIPPSLVPATRRRRAQLDAHATRQRRHKEALKARSAPSRDMIAMVALDLILLALDIDPAGKTPQYFYLALLAELQRAGYSRVQCQMRMSRMVEQIHKDRDRRSRRRIWQAQRETAAAEVAVASPADGK